VKNACTESVRERDRNRHTQIEPERDPTWPIHSVYISAWRIQEVMQYMFLHDSFSIHLCKAYSGYHMAHSVYVSPWLIQYTSLKAHSFSTHLYKAHSFSIHLYKAHSAYISAWRIQETTWLIQCMFLHGSFSIHLYKAHSASISAWRIQETTWLIQCVFLHGSFSIHLCMAYSGNYMALCLYMSSPLRGKDIPNVFSNKTLDTTPYGVTTISRLLQITGLFYKRPL